MEDACTVSSAGPPSRAALRSGELEYPDVLKLSTSQFGVEEKSRLVGEYVGKYLIEQLVRRRLGVRP
jgi:hypothetical protein